ncbi:hypothetical protein DVH24_001019 [Malus domestica]|uniref:SREBP regulating gene protein n=1 Tax=Malus domestica TaxID=3750 RepID=A0A498K486_MALDO|nr:hypothetical protein DVH24_001019 [Malus domestica]
MGIPISRPNLSLLFFHLFILQFSPRISAIRYFRRRMLAFKRSAFAKIRSKEDTYFLMIMVSLSLTAFHSVSYRICVCIVGRVCDALTVNHQSRCCPEKGETFSCYGCNVVSECCNSYEYCVSCCLNPSRITEEQVIKVKMAKPATAGTYSSAFDFCAGRCRHNSESVVSNAFMILDMRIQVHENAYLSDFHHCFSLPSNSSAANYTFLEARLNGIDVLVGRQGQSCDTVCKSKGQSCVPNKLLVLNQCDIMQKYMRCKGTCLASIGPDQPAEVVDDAPEDLVYFCFSIKVSVFWDCVL